MENLLRCRRKYVRLLDALNPSNPVDDELRAELEETISAIDAKLARGTSGAGPTLPGE